MSYEDDLRLAEGKTKKKAPPRRPGKTKKDRASGAHARNAVNKARRVDWQQDKNATANNFPYETCNGQRNRFKGR